MCLGPDSLSSALACPLDAVRSPVAPACMVRVSLVLRLQTRDSKVKRRLDSLEAAQGGSKRPSSRLERGAESLASPRDEA